jgi:hypothetical protein
MIMMYEMKRKCQNLRLKNLRFTLEMLGYIHYEVSICLQRD